MFRKKKKVYLDAGSFTPINPRALDKIFSVFNEQANLSAGNPLATHSVGRRSKQYIDEARSTVGRIENTQPENVVFTSGATESNTIAFRTMILNNLKRKRELRDMHIISTADEHESISDELDHLARFGVSHTLLNVSGSDTKIVDSIVSAMRESTVGVSVQYINNEYGRIFPIAKIADAVRLKSRSCMVHSDASQATAYYNCSPSRLRLDMVTISSMKGFGPQGVGALLFKNLSECVGLKKTNTIASMRPGTPSAALIAGFAVALDEVYKNKEENIKILKQRKRLLITNLARRVPQAKVIGIDKDIQDIAESDIDASSPHITQLTFPNTQHQYLATLLDDEGFVVTVGTACSEEPKPTIRVSLLPTTREKDLLNFVLALKSVLPLAQKR